MSFVFIVLCITLVSSRRAYCDENIYENHTLVALTPRTEEQLLKLTEFQKPSKDVEILKPARSVNGSTDILVPANETIQRLLEDYANTNGLLYVVKKTNYGRSFERLDREPKRRSGRGFNLFNYNSFAAIQNYLNELAKKYPDLLTLENVGKSYEKRNMYLAKISAKPNAKNPVMFFDAGIHSREWVAPAMAMYLIHRLVTDEQAASRELKDVDWYIMPLVNPDGYEYTRASLQNRMWRKTRSHNGGCRGVDGNRNYDFKWAVSGVSHNPCDEEVYAGPTAFSEPETRAVRNVMKKYASRLKLYVSLHAYGQYLVYPWGYTGELLPNTWKKLHRFAMRASDAVVRAGGERFNVMSAGKWYPAAGGSDDYSFGEIGVPYAYTMELTKGHDFIYPSHLLKKVLPEFFAGFQAFAEQIREEFGSKGSRKHSRRSSSEESTDSSSDEPPN